MRASTGLTRHCVATPRAWRSYLCDRYVSNDNSTGDLARLREELIAIESQHLATSTTRSGRVIRSARELGEPSNDPEQLRNLDLAQTAFARWKYGA